ncbi:cytochrome P450 [Punctularia strigosozonata HHB-11173 SS5]|uniref:Cytochrome P450 n=1 Tax=Punctularia strigosozonata (strain HHB-11173) TaxID=741275 RepID=R7S0Y6_PUNST|nr:cytochrome P450 [Punctularia strigosozonata HHB-11173 SS5]EIN04045.1 cytochrome P450 [Punctularia strigosozonata HHB-11173 SS5]
MLGNGITIVITSAKAVRELMEKQSAITVDRPVSHFGSQIVGDAVNLALAHYSDEWRVLRKTANSILTPQSAMKHVPIQRAESFQLVYDIMNTPQRAWWHLRRASNSVALSVLYGQRAPSYESEEISSLFDVVQLTSELFDPGAHPPVDMIPVLKLVPERWAAWKSLVKRLRHLQRALYLRLVKHCENRVANGEGSEQEPFIDRVIRKEGEYGLTREMTTYLGGLLLEAGSDTSASFMQSFVLMMAAFPDVQKRLHEEIDRIVGPERVPTFEDFNAMPYLQVWETHGNPRIALITPSKATIKEVHRFRPVAPLGVPHATLEDMTYEGYLIPRGSTMIVNLWGIYHDSDVFEDPEMFSPDRYLKSEYGTKSDVDPSDFRHSMPFGAGRRICPGRHLADNTIRINTMDLIWAFNFAPLVNDATGKPEPGVGTGPNPFKCSIKPRSARHADIMRNEFTNAIPLYGPYEQGLSSEEKSWLAKQRVSQV